MFSLITSSGTWTAIQFNCLWKFRLVRLVKCQGSSGWIIWLKCFSLSSRLPTFYSYHCQYKPIVTLLGEVINQLWEQPFQSADTWGPKSPFTFFKACWVLVCWGWEGLGLPGYGASTGNQKNKTIFTVRGTFYTNFKHIVFGVHIKCVPDCKFSFNPVFLNTCVSWCHVHYFRIILWPFAAGGEVKLQRQLFRLWPLGMALWVGECPKHLMILELFLFWTTLFTTRSLAGTGRPFWYEATSCAKEFDLFISIWGNSWNVFSSFSLSSPNRRISGRFLLLNHSFHTAFL